MLDFLAFVVAIIAIVLASQGCSSVGHSKPETEIRTTTSVVIEVVGQVEGIVGELKLTLLVCEAGELTLLELNKVTKPEDVLIPGYLLRTTWADEKVDYVPLQIKKER